MPDILNKKVKTPAGQAPVVPVIIVVMGAYFTWFGIHYWRSDTRWPTDPLKAVLTGKPIPVPTYGSKKAFKGIISSAQSSGTPAAGGTGTPTGGTVLPGSGTLTKNQIVQLWTSNGGAAYTAGTAGAVAMAESSGRTGVTSGNPDGGTNVGLWQLDTKGKGAGYTVTQLQDPATNARVTIMGSANGTNWSAWEAYTSGAYKKYL